MFMPSIPTHTHTSEAVKFHGVDLPNYLFRKPTINMPPKSKRPQLLKRTSDGPPPQYYWRTHGKPQELQRRVMHGLLLGWSTEIIARETGAKPRTIQYWRTNLIRYQSMNRPPLAALGRRHKLTRADKDALKEALLQHGWMIQ